MVVAGTRRTVVWDDLNPQQRISVYDRGVDLVQQAEDSVDRHTAAISYRLGDMWAPALPEVEALREMVNEFAASIHERRPAVTDGASGLRVLSVLAAAQKSLSEAGATVALPPLLQGATP
jgi:predicted dehydrogenase